MRGRLAEEFAGTQFFFQPADMISQILNFGVPAPVDIQLIGPNENANYQLAEQITNRFSMFPARGCARSAIAVLPGAISERRSHASAIGGPDTAGRSEQRAVTLSSSFQINPSFWVNPPGLNTMSPYRCRSTKSIPSALDNIPCLQLH